MTQQIFVQNILPTVTEEQIRSIFTEIGEVVEITRPLNRETKEPRKFAFIMMESDEAAARAIEELNGYELEGQQLVVREAEERKPRKPEISRDEIIRIGSEIADQLGEKDKRPRAQIIRIVEERGEEFARKLLTDTMAIQEEGGMDVADGSRKRTPGGVYFKLAKDRLDPKTRAKIFPNWREMKKRKKEQAEKQAEAEKQGKGKGKGGPAAKGGKKGGPGGGGKPGKGGGSKKKPPELPSRPAAIPSIPAPVAKQEATPEIEAELAELREVEAEAQQRLSDIQAKKVAGSPIEALKELADIRSRIAQIEKSYPSLKRKK